MYSYSYSRFVLERVPPVACGIPHTRTNKYDTAYTSSDELRRVVNSKKGDEGESSATPGGEAAGADKTINNS